MKISVLIPCRNAERTLSETLDSVLCSSSREVEVIVQDGGSTDHTVPIAQAHPSKPRIESVADRGQSDALNRALRRSTGDLIGWLNADDLYHENAIDHAYAALMARPDVDFVFGDFDLILGDGRLLRRYFVGEFGWKSLFWKGAYIFSGATFFRRRALEAVGGFDETLHCSMDLDLLLRLGCRARARHIGTRVASFRLHPTSKSGSGGLAFVRESLRVRLRHANGAPSLIALSTAGATRNAVYLMTRRFWLSETWASIRRTKKL